MLASSLDSAENGGGAVVPEGGRVQQPRKWVTDVRSRRGSM